MELIWCNFVVMGLFGKIRLVRRIEFCGSFVKDLEQFKELFDVIVQCEVLKLEVVELEQDFVDSCYFLVYKKF